MSRQRRNLLILGTVMFLILLGILDHRFGGRLRDNIAFWGPDYGDYSRYHNQCCLVLNVIDGDTLDLDIPDDNQPYTRVRLLGIDTPEKQIGDNPAMYFGPEATNFTDKLAHQQKVTVLLDTIGDVRDKYKRLLAYIRLPDGRILNEQILQHGYGYADLRFQHSQFDKYCVLQQQAMDDRAGLWAKVRQDQFPPWLHRQRPDLLNKR
jgi:endonuclease YncB( thermonuclease family)